LKTILSINNDEDESEAGDLLANNAFSKFNQGVSQKNNTLQKIKSMKSLNNRSANLIVEQSNKSKIELTKSQST
jgi:hypothetical protein